MMKESRPGESPKVLVIDDEPRLVRLLKANLESSGYRVASALNAHDGIEAVGEESPDLVLLDVALPDGDGFSVCRRIREFSDVPIIMLTARSREGDKLEGFHSGADDYVTKPFSSPELMARVKAVMKRRGAKDKQEKTEVSVGDIHINFVQRRVHKGGHEIRLTNIEYSLLHELAINSGKVLLHSELLSRVWGTEYKDELEYLRAYIRHLRRKIEDDPGNPTIIKSVPGIGYTFATDE